MARTRPLHKQQANNTRHLLAALRNPELSPALSSPNLSNTLLILTLFFPELVQARDDENYGEDIALIMGGIAVVIYVVYALSKVCCCSGPSLRTSMPSREVNRNNQPREIAVSMPAAKAQTHVPNSGTQNNNAFFPAANEALAKSYSTRWTDIETGYKAFGLAGPELPSEYQDIVTYDVIDDPVIINDGHTYDRATIESIIAIAKKKGLQPYCPLDPSKVITIVDRDDSMHQDFNRFLLEHEQYLKALKESNEKSPQATQEDTNTIQVRIA